MTLVAEPLTNAYRQTWNDVCSDSSDAWFWHTTHWLDYTLATDSEGGARNLSFLVRDQDRFLAVVPAVCQTSRHGLVDVTELSYSGGWMPSAACVDGLTCRHRKKVTDFAVSHLVDQAAAHGAACIRLRSNPFAFASGHDQDLVVPAARHGFSLSVLPTQIIDVRPPADRLWKGLRKGHKSAVKSAGKCLDVRISCQGQTDDTLFAAYEKCHHKAAGRKTRPGSTFSLMQEWIGQGFGALFAAFRNGVPASFAYVYTYKNSAYYGSACNDPDQTDLGLAHFLQWEILKWLHERGFEHYEIGWQHYGPNAHFPVSEKEVSISGFKRGFGGAAVPIVVSVRHLCEAGFLAEAQALNQAYVETLRQAAAP